jgi:AAA domain/UvrD-like helicase C-terminal domain
VTALNPTPEQQAILDAAGTGGTVAISAAAGSGKTSTLRMVAAARPKTRMLYVAFNKAIQREAETSFPSNVTCKTAHALAYAAFGKPMRDRLNGPRMTGRDNAQVLGITRPLGSDAERFFKEPTLASMAMGMVARFCSSDSPAITLRHFRAPEGLTEAEERHIAAYLLPYAIRAWQDLTAGPAGKLKPSHDVYLKQWALSHPPLAGWEVILYDEAQDADPCIAGVVESQRHAQLIAVGDSAQAIYGWRGAGDFLGRVDADHRRLRLTQSWRFGAAVADEANTWLGVVGTDLRVVGNPNRDSTLDTLDTPDAVLCRSNGGTIQQLLDAHHKGVRVHLVGEGKEMLALAQAAERMQDGRPAAHPELIAFTTWQEVVDYAENDPGGSDLAVAVQMIERYGPSDVMRAINGAVSADRAELRVSTAHKSKGLEWDRVRITSDFREPLDKATGQPLPIPREDAMLAYVALTRAKLVLDTGGLGWVHDHLAALANPARWTVDREHTPAVETMAELYRSPISTLPASSTPKRTPAGLSPNDNGAGRCETPQPEAPPVPSNPAESTADYLARWALHIGDSVLVAEERGVYVIRSIARDGSLTLYREDKTGGARNFRPEWCTPALRQGKGGKQVRVRAVSPEARAARAAWQAASQQPLLDDLPGVGLGGLGARLAR